ADWARAGLNTPDLHGPGLEYRVQLLFFAQEYSSRLEGSRTYKSIQRMAAVRAARAAIFGDRPGLELDDVRGWRLVLSNGMRDVSSGAAPGPPAGAWIVPSDRRERRRHGGHSLGAGCDGRRNSVARPGGLETRNRLG